jgi:hypothetical protein
MAALEARPDYKDAKSRVDFSMFLKDNNLEGPARILA